MVFLCALTFLPSIIRPPIKVFRTKQSISIIPHCPENLASGINYMSLFPIFLGIREKLSHLMDRLNGSARLMIVSDLDSTMVDHEDPEDVSLLRFNALWEAHYRHDSLLVFSTGRSPASYKQLRKEKPLLTPDIAVMSVGTEIAYGDAMLVDAGWEEILSRKWNRDIVVEETAKFPELIPQAEIDQRPDKVSFFVEKVNAQRIIDVLSERLEKRGLDIKIIYSSGTALDVLPQGAGKGQALAYLLKKFESDGKPPANTLVCGDSGNDAELFSIPEVYGVMVGNAQEELLQWHLENMKNNPKIIHATQRCTAGIIEAIGRFGLGPNVSPRDIMDFQKWNGENVNPVYEVVNFYLFYERWRCAQVQKSEYYLQKLRSMFYPLCSFIHPSGTEWSIHQCIDAMERLHGDRQGKQYKVWVDRVSSAQIGSGSWLVKCNKWESFGEERYCCLTTILISSKADVPNAFVWLHMHQTWLDGPDVKHPDTWLF